MVGPITLFDVDSRTPRPPIRPLGRHVYRKTIAIAPYISHQSTDTPVWKLDTLTWRITDTSVWIGERIVLIVPIIHDLYMNEVTPPANVLLVTYLSWDSTLAPTTTLPSLPLPCLSLLPTAINLRSAFIASFRHVSLPPSLGSFLAARSTFLAPLILASLHRASRP